MTVRIATAFWHNLWHSSVCWCKSLIFLDFFACVKYVIDFFDDVKGGLLMVRILTNFRQIVFFNALHLISSFFLYLGWRGGGE